MKMVGWSRGLGGSVDDVEGRSWCGGGRVLWWWKEGGRVSEFVRLWGNWTAKGTFTRHRTTMMSHADGEIF